MKIVKNDLLAKQSLATPKSSRTRPERRVVVKGLLRVCLTRKK